MEEAEIFALLLFKRRQVGTRSFKQMKRSEHVGAKEGFGAQNGPIDMAFGGKVDDRRRPVIGEQPVHGLAVADIAPDEDMVGVALKRSEVAQVACIGEKIEVDHPAFVLRNPIKNEIRSNKSG